MIIKLMTLIVISCYYKEFGVFGKSVIDGFCHPKCFEKCLPSCTCCNADVDNSERRNKIKRRILENVLKQKQLEVGFVCHSYCKTRCLPSCKFSCCEKQNSTEEVGEHSIVFEEGFDLSKLLKSLQETQNEYRKFKSYIGKLHNATTHKLKHPSHHYSQHTHKSKLKIRNNLMSNKSEQKATLKNKKKQSKKKSKEKNNKVTNKNEVTTNDKVIKSEYDEKENVTDVSSSVLSSNADKMQFINEKSNDMNGYDSDEFNSHTEELEDQHSGNYELQLNPLGYPRSESTTQHLPPHGNFIYNPFYVSNELKGSHILTQKQKSNKKKKPIKKRRTQKKNYYQTFKKKLNDINSNGNGKKVSGNENKSNDNGKKSVDLSFDTLVTNQNFQSSEDSKETEKVKALDNTRKITKALKEIANLQTTIKENIENDKIVKLNSMQKKENSNFKIKTAVKPFISRKLDTTNSKSHNFKKLKPAPSMFQELQEVDPSTYSADQHPNHAKVLNKKSNKMAYKNKRKKGNRNLNKQASKQSNNILNILSTNQNENSSYSNFYDSKTNQESFALKSSDSVTESVDQQPSVSQSSNLVTENIAKQPSVIFTDNLTSYPMPSQAVIQNESQQTNQNELYSQQTNQCAASCGMLCSPFCENICCENSIYQKYLEPKHVDLQPTPALQIQAPKKNYEDAYTQSPNSIYGENALSLKDTNTKAIKLSEATLSATRRRIQDLISLLQETSKNIETNNVANTNVCHIGCKKHCLPSCHFECC
ncbi:probable cyclin-dependent serine/threonine-protein kinase DDB_G0292550 [Hydra vulgaris]|uniref:probable cyclin-dependent serine/threonine-protein kinase DDB_G0292550 n=1 Tax=Hydra vulgaris TaxID=6087 RepID=UPI001F5ED767|nr:probable cyclin-dependent serine/threonine-protein kinase DDB_G0292550 [Hydra vulgaris]